MTHPAEAGDMVPWRCHPGRLPYPVGEAVVCIPTNGPNHLIAVGRPCPCRAA